MLRPWVSASTETPTPDGRQGSQPAQLSHATPRRQRADTLAGKVAQLGLGVYLCRGEVARPT
eukprot:11759057-Heterocapsa_arctica.AAC.1